MSSLSTGQMPRVFAGGGGRWIGSWYVRKWWLLYSRIDNRIFGVGHGNCIYSRFTSLTDSTFLCESPPILNHEEY